MSEKVLNNKKVFIQERAKKDQKQNKKKRKGRIEYLFKMIFFLCAMTAVISVTVITVYIFKMGVPAIFQIGFFDFIFGEEWYPEAEIFGIFSMVVASVYTTIGAVLIGIPIGILTAVFMCEFAPKKGACFMNSAVNLLAGIPSVVYGFFGLVVIVPLINQFLGGRGAGSSLFAACIILGIMILPTIISTSRTALLAVPKEYREGAFALGASHIHTIFSLLIPAAKSGIFSGIVLGIGRAVGETMAVILVAGNAAILPQSITDPVRTMTANIAIEMGYSYGLHQEALFATGVILFLFIMMLNLILYKIQSREGS